MKSIAIVMEKGGVGKTTTTLNLGDALAQQGKRVLMIDLDAQRSLTQWCGVASTDADKTIYSALLSDADPNAMVIDRKGGASLLPGSSAMAEVADKLNRDVAPQFALRDVIAKLEPSWDFVLIDCPPSLNILTTNALTAATHCIIPVKTDFISIAGLPGVLASIKKVQSRLNPNLVNVGVLPTLHSGQLKEHANTLAYLSSQLPALKTPVLDPIPRTTAVEQSSSKQTSVVLSASDATASVAYMALATHLINTL